MRTGNGKYLAQGRHQAGQGLIKRSERDLVCNEAVSTALYVRFLKRISAHLMNIASSIVNPFDRIGFRDDDPDNPSDDG